MYTLAILLVLPALALAQGSLYPYDQTAQSLFQVIDADGNLVILRPEVDTYFSGFDTDGDNRITHHEFSVYIDQNNQAFVGHENELYAMFDVNGDNHLDHIDFDYLFSLTDGDGDAVVTQSEFIHYWSLIFELIDQSP